MNSRLKRPKNSRHCSKNNEVATKVY